MRIGVGGGSSTTTTSITTRNSSCSSILRLAIIGTIVWVLLLTTVVTAESTGGDGDGDGDGDKETEKEQQQKKRAELASTMRRRWQNTFEEIQALVVDFNSPPSSSTTATKITSTSSTSSSEEEEEEEAMTASPSSSWRKRGLDEWKLLLDNGARRLPTTVTNLSRQRFVDGFASWEAQYEQWAEDVAEYLVSSSSTSTTASDQEEEEEKDVNGNYPLSTYGRRRQPPLTTDDNTSSSSTPITITQQQSSSQQTFTPRTILPNEPILPHTNLSDLTKKIWIVTTAAYPWMTGTSINPLLRAAYLATERAQYQSTTPSTATGDDTTTTTTNNNGGIVTLMLPWLERTSDREEIYGPSVNKKFTTPDQQEQVIRHWLRHDANMPIAAKVLRIRWYTGRLYREEGSIYSMGDIISLIPTEDVDICVLEEPEHLNWYRAPGEGWTTKFPHVVGIVHTNYFVYAQEQPGAVIRAPGMRLLSSWMCRAHCHRIIKLSGTLGSFAPEKELVENVHGVRETYLEYGADLASRLRLVKQQQQPQQPAPHVIQHHFSDNTSDNDEDPIFGPNATPSVYFIGKMLWSKGIGSLLELLEYAEENAGLKVTVDMYGGGPNLEEAKVKAEKMGLDMRFFGPVDHAVLAPSHKIFVNPSLSEVLCTTVAEALAMGKFAVVPSHPSNDFFAQFPNCLTYANKEEFVGNLYYAMTHSPEPLSVEYTYALSWKAACKRFEAAGGISVEEAGALKEAIATEDASIEIGLDLPPLIEDPTRRDQISNTVKKTRARYRNFRSKLSDEIRQSNALPKEVQTRLIKELDRRLDLDVDTLLGGSPKLKLQLSPAELDRRLLEFYNDIAGGPRGDVLRWIGAGGSTTVSAQYLYLRNQELKKWQEEQVKWQQQSDDSGDNDDDRENTVVTNVPQFLEDVGAGRSPTATKWIKRALKRNLQQTTTTAPSTTTSFVPKSELPSINETTKRLPSSVSNDDDDDISQMSLEQGNIRRPKIGSSKISSSKLYSRPKPVHFNRMIMSSSSIPHLHHSFAVGPLI